MGIFWFSVVLSLALTAGSIPVLRRLQFIDVPNHRSSHARPVPRGGGIAVISVVVVSVLSFVDVSGAVVGLVTLTVIMAATGLVDDAMTLPSGWRFVAQVACASVLAVILLSLGTASWWWLPVIIIAVAGYVNAFNFMDGINAISSATAALVGGYWTVVGHLEGATELRLLGLVLSGAALGFLPWNAPKARVFLGDVGSYGVGFFVAGMSALALCSGIPWSWALAPLFIYGADTGWVLVKRLRNGRSLTEAHREHVYQRLVDAGMSHVMSAVLCATAGVVVCSAVLIGEGAVIWPGCVAVMTALAYLGIPRILRTPGGMEGR